MEYLKKAAAREETEGCARVVAEMIRNVRASGDRALLEYNTRFDGNDRTQFRVTREEIDAAYARMTEQELSDLRQAAQNIRASRGWTASPRWKIPSWGTGSSLCPPAAAMCPAGPTRSSPPR